MSLRIGIDLGGTKIEGAVLDASARIIARHRVPTPADDYHAICAAIAALVARLEGMLASGTRVGAGIGVGIPGSVSPSSGRIRNANTVCLNGQPLAADLATLLGRPVRLENDANCLVLSEVNDGAATGASCVFGVVLGTGTGGGLYVNGALVRGANAIAGEWGHNHVPWSVDTQASRVCYCGRRDCIETYLSGPGLLRTYVTLGGTAARAVETVVARAAAGEAPARAALGQHREALARCLAGIVNVVDPDLIVLAGGLANLSGLASDIAARLPTLAFADALHTQVTVARHGDSSGVRGAACLWAPGEARRA